MKNNTCYNCKHKQCGIKNEPCKSCDILSHSLWESAGHSFNEDICRALAEGKDVWCKDLDTDWVKYETCYVDLSHAYKAEWTLINPHKQQKTIEPDYSFNQSIIDALREGKAVWLKNDFGEWIEVKNSFPIYVGSVHTCQWSLTKPATKTKKTIERWIRKDDIKDFEECGQYWTMSNIETREYGTKITLSYEVGSE